MLFSIIPIQPQYIYIHIYIYHTEVLKLIMMREGYEPNKVLKMNKLASPMMSFLKEEEDSPVLGGSWDLVITYNWDYNPIYNWRYPYKPI